MSLRNFSPEATAAFQEGLLLPAQRANFEILCCRQAAGHNGQGTLTKVSRVAEPEHPTYYVALAAPVLTVRTFHVRILLNATVS